MSSPYKPKKNLYLLSALDTSDKLNMLLLEVRHLQQSIIYKLHDPVLYRLLRYEENYIFGGWETIDDIFESIKGYSVSEIVAESVIRYPSPKKAIRYWSKEYKEDDDQDLEGIEKDILIHIGEVFAADTWIREERQHYYALRALQILKQQIFRDKLILFSNIKKTDIIKSQNINVESKRLDKSAFLILRRGIHYRMKRYIDSLKTQQQNFSKSLDFGLQRGIRPSIDRRREIGIFHDFLSNRTIDIQSDFLHLVSEITDKNEVDIRRESPMLLHGWSQRMHVRNNPLWDDMGSDLADNKWKQDICYIDTSFWSPDRPDLQPLVAKEIVYASLRTLSNSFSDDYFSNYTNPLSELWVTLSRTINDFTHDRAGLEPIHKRSEYLVRRLVVDCLAASVKGVSYLYAIFISENSYGLEDLLRINRIVRLEAVDDLFTGLGSYGQHYEWYFRLKFTAFWLREVAELRHLPLSSLDKIVLDGTDEVCNSMIHFLDSNNISATREAVGREWVELYDEIEKDVSPLPLLKMVKNWRECRSKDTWDEQKECTGLKVYHRSTMPLDTRLQNFLFRETVRQKRHKNKSLENCSSENLVDSFCDAYGLEVVEVKIPYLQGDMYVRQPRNLYRQLHDIAFQCSIMRSIDFLGNEKNNLTWKSFIKQTHSDIGFGREIFSFALEFYTWRRESPKSRLLLSINLLSFLLPTLRKATKKLILKIAKDFEFWLFTYNDKNHEKEEYAIEIAEQLIEELKGLNHKKIQQYYGGGDKGNINEERMGEIGAIQINNALSQGRVNSVSMQRRLEQIAGYKIKELSQILDKDVQSLIEKGKGLEEQFDKFAFDEIEYISTLGDLRHFLSIRDDSESKPASLGRFYSLLFNAFDGGNRNTCYYYDPKTLESYSSKDFGLKKLVPSMFGQKTLNLLSGLEKEKNLPQAIKPIIVSRLSISNFYTVSNPKAKHKLKDKESADIAGSSKSLGLYQSLKKQRWYRKDTSSQYSIVLGRYDVVSLTKTRLPCLCPISCFDDVSSDLSRNDAVDEKFASHFARREIALSMKLHGDYEFDQSLQDVDSNTKFDSHYVYAIASISLQRRSMRLNLLYRLLNAISNLSEVYSKNSIEERIRDIIIDKDVRAEDLSISGLLTDGWGDLLLVFMVKKNKQIKPELYDQILNLQQALYEDFMVDRTELIYTPQCLDEMLKTGKYKLSFLFRFQEDRKLERSLTHFIEALKRKKPPFMEYDMSNDFTIYFTPGQYDAKVEFNIKFGEETGVYSKLLEWFAKPEIYNQWYQDGISCIDSIETRIDKIKYQYVFSEET